MDGLTGGRHLRLFEKTLLFLLPHPVWWRALFFPQHSSCISLSKRKLWNHSSSRKSVSRPPASLYTVCSSLLYHSRVFFARFFHLGRFFLSFSQLFSFVPAPSYHPVLAWSPRLRNILSSVVPFVYYFISDTYTISNTRRVKNWNNFVFSIWNFKCFSSYLIFVTGAKGGAV